ncbi:hypothetical protein ACQ4PT_064123 [Festuca glaucescens]
MEACKVSAALLLAALLLLGPASATASSYHPAKVVGGLLTSTATAVVKKLWSLSLKSTTSTRTATGTAAAAAAGRSMVRYEGGYAVETVFDGSKLGIEPYAVEVTPAGELLVLDSMNSNVYRVQLPLSRYSRPKIVTGSPEGLSGHVDGRLREARLNHPKGFAVDDRGNIYVADAMNMAIRKISDTGIPPYQPYQSYQHPFKPSLRPPLIPNEDEAGKQDAEEGFFTSIGKFMGGAKSSVADIFSRKRRPTRQHHHQQQRRANPWPVQEGYAIPNDETPPPLDTRAPTPRKNYAFMTTEPEKVHHVRHGQPYLSSWDARGPQQQPEHQVYHHHQQQHRQQLEQQAYHRQQLQNRQLPEQQAYQQQQQHRRQPEQQMYHLQQHRQYSAGPQTFYEQSCETTNEVVFGAVQEVDSKRHMVEIKAMNYGDTFYEQYRMRYRNNYIGYNSNNNY